MGTIRVQCPREKGKEVYLKAWAVCRDGDKGLIPQCVAVREVQSPNGTGLEQGQECRLLRSVQRSDAVHAEDLQLAAMSNDLVHTLAGNLRAAADIDVGD